MPPSRAEKIGIKMDPKRIALFDVKLVSRDTVIHIPYKIHNIHVHYDTTCGCKHRLKKANDSRELLILVV